MSNAQANCGPRARPLAATDSTHRKRREPRSRQLQPVVSLLQCSGFKPVDFETCPVTHTTCIPVDWRLYSRSNRRFASLKIGVSIPIFFPVVHHFWGNLALKYKRPLQLPFNVYFPRMFRWMIIARPWITALAPFNEVTTFPEVVV
jgi:hypothetical protein